MKRFSGVIGLAFAVALIWSGYTPVTAAKKPLVEGNEMSALSSRNASELEQSLTELVNGVINRQQREEGQADGNIDVVVRLDTARGFAVVETDIGFLPSDFTPLFEDQMSDVSNEILFALNHEVVLQGVEFVIAGRKLDHYFPEYFPKQKPPSQKKRSTGLGEKKVPGSLFTPRRSRT